MADTITPTTLAEAAGISISYASMILSDNPAKKREPPLTLALKIFCTTGLKTGPIAKATDAQIATMAEVCGVAA